MEALKTKEVDKKEKKIITKEPEKKDENIKDEEIVCPICGSREVVKDYERAEIVCAKCGCVIKEKLFDIGPEWRAFDHEQKIKRCRVGAPMTYSVDYSEPIIIKEKGEIKVVKIGELIDEIIKNSKNVRKDGILEIARCKDVEVIAFDSNYKFKFMPVSEVSRHPVSEMFEIVVEGNKKVRVTGSHSVFTVKDNEVVPIRVDDLRVGDILVLAKELPNIEEENAIDKKFAKILAYIVSEGYYNEEKLIFSFNCNKREVIDEVISYFKSLKSEISIYNKNSDIQIEVKDKEIINILKKLGIENKRVPSIIFKSPYGIKKSFIDGLFNGKDTKIFTSKELAEDAIFLLLQIKENAILNKKIIKGISVYEVKRIPNIYNNRKLEKLINSDFIFLKIKKINKVEPTNGYAYDLTVPNAENFIAGFGGFVLHNTIHDKGLSTVIDWRNKDSYGKDLSANKRAQLYRLRKWQRRIRVSDAAERNLAFALSELDRITSKLGLPRHVRENAAIIYRNAVEKGLIRGRSIEGVVAAAIYAACRRCRVPRTLDEIAEASRVDRKEIGRTYRFLARELNIKLTPTNPIDYVPRFASELGLPGEVESKAIQILQQATEKGLTSGRGPTGVAAAAIYIASVLLGCRRTQREVAEVAGVTEVTIRNRYKELTEHLDIDVTL
ncbi:Transcription factor TFIIB cyclin-releated protein [Methanocaldococcus vulcanius M7]|uniref:Transcription initiation factor IIB n=1 Tax=Methanocaldococcus vulcanius (strain ATCC 700851 / DSM 12094 / M7) TaxID=579137 RepID=C9REA0_METVM|nr:Transcription factor TFIIB cyclin-releated protein [Methanocaldococcus vulcanius M7]